MKPRRGIVLAEYKDKISITGLIHYMGEIVLATANQVYIFNRKSGEWEILEKQLSSKEVE